MAKQARGAVVTLRMSEEEQATLRRAAEVENVSVSEYVRSIVRGDRVLTIPGYAGEAATADRSVVTLRSDAPIDMSGGAEVSLWATTAAGEAIDGQNITLSSAD